MTNWNQKRAVAEHLGMDYAEMGDYEYQPGRHGRFKVYAVGDYYYVAGADGSSENPPKGYKWEWVHDRHVNHYGWIILRAKAEEES